MPVRDFPPPPLDRDFPANGYTSLGRELLGASLAALIIAFFVGLAFAVETSDKKRRAFIAKCIEFQTVDRCGTLYEYGRQDLVEQRR